MPKKRANLKAVSAVIERFPETISPMHRWETLIDFASLYRVIPIGFRKSSIRISPGWIGGISLFIVSLLGEKEPLKIGVKTNLFRVIGTVGAWKF